MAGSAHTWADNDVATATYLNALPRGVMAYATKTADQTTITSAVDITSLSVTFTAISTRLYRTTLGMRFVQLTAGSTAALYIADGASATKQQWGFTLVTNAEAGTALTLLETGLSGSTTRKGRASTGAGTLTIYGAATYPAFILVEDLGPA